ncbi:HigA family addiction module antidote protein [Bradyrhizobium sp. INPA01-394B]|uniref:HigA family addiction module antidote protein n=1 Tax=Bradyrhizobium campsiandrae TaxID=1729892 RepID=A0ABR7U8C3_9BRAD|nr:HigA family addiction module antitoxin [Bradyrhizobium campsiandrae]MBC9880867.1 HigA family addiction module antidote protein [Bradyrhizobium campsiandrae]MBC9980299.1 HigA family addiction module antidote protein [Bradyrhizobium campsiandrae]
MAQEQHIFEPDYAVRPGAFLEESLEAMGISARELARRCGRSAKLIVEILSGKAPVEPETALQFEKVTDVSAAIWLNLESEYRLHLARQSEDRKLSDSFAWAREFPLREMQERGIIEQSKDNADTVRKLLKFFGVAGIDACEASFASYSIAFRHSPSFQTDNKSLYSWLRLGEIQAEAIVCKDYDRATFLKSLSKIRTLTSKSVDEVLPEIESICARAGVAFVLTRPIGKMSLSGISRWLSPRKALIQQTMRHKANDHFWFTFFHEAAHIILHSRKMVFVVKPDTADEDEANKWAAEFLIPAAELAKFVRAGDFSEEAVLDFAGVQGIAAGIVVGQLQKRDHLTYRQLNHLKQRFEWGE